MSPELSRRRLLQAVTGAAALWLVGPWDPSHALASEPRGAADEEDGPGGPVRPVEPTLEAFADTLIPGEKRYPDDRAVAGAADGPGAVQAGALALLVSPAAGTRELATSMSAVLDARAAQFAARERLQPDPDVSPMVALDFEHRTDLLVELLDGDDPDQQVWEALAAIVFLAYHTAGHLPTAEAVRDGHPGLQAIGFPSPDDDGLWRHEVHSYGRPLAREHPATTTGGHPR
jgi:enediyne biosynthesis protein E8